MLIMVDDINVFVFIVNAKSKINNAYFIYLFWKMFQLKVFINSL